ncbi:MAG: DMT family transporter [Desulfobacterales bacterium]|nr:DMT family transporter [Desulfobacterales bacterium]
MTKPSRGLFFLYPAVFLLSLTGLFAKLIPLDATSITQLRSSIAVGGFLIFYLFQKRTFRLVGFSQCVGIYGLGILLGVHWVTFFYAMQVSTVAVGMLSLFSFPMITILLEPFFIKEKHKLRDVVAGTLVLVGIAVMVSQDLTGIDGSVIQGVFWGVLSAVLFSLRNLFQKYRFDNVTSDSLMFHQVVAVAVMLVPFIDYSQIASLAQIDWGKLLLLGILSTATAHTLLSYSLKLLPAKSIALIGCLQPLLATLLAWLVVQEVPQLPVILGGGIILSVAMYESVQKR